MLKIKKVLKNKVGYELGFEKGDSIIAFNKQKVVDVLDYIYYDSEEEFTISVLAKNGESVEVEVSKESFESLGLIFENDNLDVKTCQNKCIFCFVDQMPPNMRKSLYLKDDDYRQSFLRGNFITLTNLKESDLDRIIRLKLSPIYVSVQCMDGDVRQKMLNNRFAKNVYEQLKRLTDGGIKIHTQIVLVKNVNDGKFLDYSLEKLYSLKPNLLSVAIVPCGITKYRENLTKIENLDKNYSNCVIEQVENFNLEKGENFALLADEFYFMAEKPLKDVEAYGDFAQIGNGVGLTTKFKTELELSKTKTKNNQKPLIIVGESCYKFMLEQVSELKKDIENLDAKVLPIKNYFFGETVNCTGLLTAGDIIKGVKDFKEDFDYLVLSDVCLKQGEDVFLDDITLMEFRKAINKKIVITNGSGQSFFDALSNGDNIRII